MLLEYQKPNSDKDPETLYQGFGLDILIQINLSKSKVVTKKGVSEGKEMSIGKK